MAHFPRPENSNLSDTHSTVLVKRLEVSLAKIALNLLDILHIWPRALMRTSWNSDLLSELQYHAYNSKYVS